jgi:D-alanine-D-alanine ligase
MQNEPSNLLKSLAIGVLYGGPSSEREVSIDSGENCAKALEAAGYDVHRVLLDGSFTAQNARDLGIDVALLALHGEFGEDGRIQEILEEADIPYTGSGIDASSRAFDKMLAKQCFERAGVRTPAWMCIDICDIEKKGGAARMYLVPPVVVKPATGGSSLGITIVKSENQIGPAINKAAEYGDSILIERFVKGRELTVGILNGAALPVLELKPATEFFDYNAKYKDDTTQMQCPALLPEDVTRRVQETALAAHNALLCRDVSRVDIILDRDHLPWVLEVNTLPGMTSHSLLPRVAAVNGLSFTDLCEELLRAALKRSMARTL